MILIVSTRTVVGLGLTRQLEGIGAPCTALALPDALAHCAAAWHLVVMHCHGRDPEIARAVREIADTPFHPPIVVVTAEPVDSDEAWEFWAEAGAADTVNEEHLRRLQGVVRRELARGPTEDGVLVAGGGRLDIQHGTYDGRAKRIRLTAQEGNTVTALFAVWRESPGGWASPSAVRSAWPAHPPPRLKQIPVLVHRVSKSLWGADVTPGNPDPPTWLETRRGRGYRLRRFQEPPGGAPR